MHRNLYIHISLNFCTTKSNTFSHLYNSTHYKGQGQKNLTPSLPSNAMSSALPSFSSVCSARRNNQSSNPWNASPSVSSPFASSNNVHTVFIMLFDDMYLYISLPHSSGVRHMIRHSFWSFGSFHSRWPFFRSSSRTICTPSMGSFLLISLLVKIAESASFTSSEWLFLFFWCSRTYWHQASSCFFLVSMFGWMVKNGGKLNCHGFSTDPIVHEIMYLKYCKHNWQLILQQWFKCLTKMLNNRKPWSSVKQQLLVLHKDSSQLLVENNWNIWRLSSTDTNKCICF